MGLKPSPSGETFRFYNFCPFEVWNTFWLWLSFLVLRVVMRCATDWNALDNPSLINCRGRYCVRSLVRIGLQSVAHETSPNLPASAGSGSVRPNKRFFTPFHPVSLNYRIKFSDFELVPAIREQGDVHLSHLQIT